MLVITRAKTNVKEMDAKMVIMVSWSLFSYRASVDGARMISHLAYE